MNGKRVLIIGLAAAAIIAVAVGLRSFEQSRYQGQDGELLFPNLAERTEDISRIELRRGADQRITLVRSEDGWGVAERDGYPANTKNIRRLLVSLSETRLEEPKTSQPERYAQLSVGDPDKDASARLVRLLDTDGNAIAEVILGKSGRGGHYLRLPDEAQSWLGSENLGFGVNHREWLDRELLRISQERIRRMDMQPASGKSYSVVRDEEGRLELDPPAPDGYRIKPGMLNRLLAVMQNLDADDVHMQDVPEDGWARAEYQLDDGMTIVLHSRPKDDQQSGALVRIDIAADGSASEEVRTQAESLDRKFEGRTYQIPNHQALMMGQPWNKVIEEVADAGDS